MFKKAKSFIQTKVQAVKDFCAEKVSQKAHEVLDGTIAEAYVDIRVVKGSKVTVVLKGGLQIEEALS